jgi:hypothetical protein
MEQCRYPWLTIAKDDFGPREQEGFEGLAREIADPNSNAHKKILGSKKRRKTFLTHSWGRFAMISPYFPAQ